jgi:putative transposase
MATEGLPVKLACRVLRVSESGYYARRSMPPSPRSIRHAWLTDLIRQAHLASRGTYGIRRVHAELTLGHGVAIGHQAVEWLMRRAGIQGISGRPKFRRVPGVATAEDRVVRDQPVCGDGWRVSHESNLVDPRRGLEPGMSDRSLTLTP